MPSFLHWLCRFTDLTMTTWRHGAGSAVDENKALGANREWYLPCTNVGVRVVDQTLVLLKGDDIPMVGAYFLPRFF